MTKKRIDGRTIEAKKLRLQYEKFMSGSGNDPKNQELCRAASGLTLRLDLLNFDLANGVQVNVADYTRLVNSLHRILSSLGLASWLVDPEKEPKKKPDPVGDYLKESQK